MVDVSTYGSTQLSYANPSPLPLGQKVGSIFLICVVHSGGIGCRVISGYHIDALPKRVSRPIRVI